MKICLSLFMAVVCSLFLVVPPGSAQQNCKAFHVIVQARLYDPSVPVTPPSPYTYGWSGPFAGTLDGVAVAGFLSYAEPPSVDFPPPGPVNKGKAGKETNVIFKFEVTDPSGSVGSFQSVKDSAVFPVAPGQGLGNYTSTATIDTTKGTGIFEDASGFFTLAGPAIAPVVPPPAILQYALGLWSPEVNGKICTQ